LQLLLEPSLLLLEPGLCPLGVRVCLLGIVLGGLEPLLQHGNLGLDACVAVRLGLGVQLEVGLSLLLRSLHFLLQLPELIAEGLPRRLDCGVGPLALSILRRQPVSFCLRVAVFPLHGLDDGCIFCPGLVDQDSRVRFVLSLQTCNLIFKILPLLVVVGLRLGKLLLRVVGNRLGARHPLRQLAILALEAAHQRRHSRLGLRTKLLEQLVRCLRHLRAVCLDCLLRMGGSQVSFAHLTLGPVVLFPQLLDLHPKAVVLLPQSPCVFVVLLLHVRIVIQPHRGVVCSGPHHPGTGGCRQCPCRLLRLGSLRLHRLHLCLHLAQGLRVLAKHGFGSGGFLLGLPLLHGGLLPCKDGSGWVHRRWVDGCRSRRCHRERGCSCRWCGGRRSCVGSAGDCRLRKSKHGKVGRERSGLCRCGDIIQAVAFVVGQVSDLGILLGAVIVAAPFEVIGHDHPPVLLAGSTRFCHDGAIFGACPRPKRRRARRLWPSSGSGWSPNEIMGGLCCRSREPDQQPEPNEVIHGVHPDGMVDPPYSCHEDCCAPATDGFFLAFCCTARTPQFRQTHHRLFMGLTAMNCLNPLDVNKYLNVLLPKIVELERECRRVTCLHNLLGWSHTVLAILIPFTVALMINYNVDQVTNNTVVQATTAVSALLLAGTGTIRPITEPLVRCVNAIDREVTDFANLSKDFSRYMANHYGRFRWPRALRRLIVKIQTLVNEFNKSTVEARYAQASKPNVPKLKQSELKQELQS